jgi:Ca-activated chloride channel homolog
MWDYKLRMMPNKNILLLLFLLGLGFFSSGQVKFDKTSHDFGDLYPENSRFIDIYLKNNGNKDAFILSVKKPQEVVYIQRGAMILPDSTQVIRIQVNPTKKGRFSYEIPVYTSDRNEPTIIKLTGNLKELPSRQDNSFTDCPNFNQKPGDGNPLDFKLTVVTIDKETKEPLANSEVKLIQNGRRIGIWQTNKQGKIIEKVPLGITYFYATHSGYYPAELGAYINFKRDYIVLELEREPFQVIPEPFVQETPPEELITLIEEKPVREIILDDSDIVVEDRNDSSIFERLKDIFRRKPVDLDTTPVITPNYPDFAQLDPDNFDSELFAPINVVFIIDVSYSMNQADRMELMKFSLLQLTDMLRPQDRIALVSYATNAKVILPSISGKEKDRISEEVSKLTAQGSTAGGAGIKLGYKVARQNLLRDGTNHVIIITDGAFNVTSGDYKKEIRKNLGRGISFSVVSLKSAERDIENLQEAAEIGRGRLVRVDKLSDAEKNLKQEIRLTAFKGK